MSEAFKIVFRPGTVEVYNGRRATIFVCAEFDGARLSITSVEGPKLNGDCLGSCGQATDGLRDATFQPAEGWTRESVDRLLAIWERWHLNDMRPHTAEMRAAGWHKKARLEMLGYHFSLTSDVWQERREAEAAALAALRVGQSFKPSDRQAEVAAAPLSLVIWRYATEAEPSAPPMYERTRELRGNGIKPAERKTLGWLREAEHADGLLGRELGGKSYGGAWYAEAVPDSVLAELRAFPAYDRPLQWFNYRPESA